MKENLTEEDYHRMVNECLVEIGVNEFFLQFIVCDMRKVVDLIAFRALPHYTTISVKIVETTLLNEVRVPSFVEYADRAKSIIMCRLRERLHHDKFEGILAETVLG